MILKKLIQKFYSINSKSKQFQRLFHFDSKVFKESQRNPQSELLNFLSTELTPECDELSSQNFYKLIHLKHLWKDKLKSKDSVRLLLEQNDYSKWRKSLKIIDSKCCSMIESLSATEILGFLTFLMRVEPIRVTQTNFYQKSIKYLRILLKRKQLSSEEILILLFFAGLEKKKGAHNVKAIKQWLPPLNKLSAAEHSIIAETLFKCSLKCSKNHKRIIEKIIERDAGLLVDENLWLVPLCKAVRFGKPSKDFSLNNLSNSLILSQNEFSPIDCAHIISLFAECYLKRTDVLDRLFERFFMAFRKENQLVRIKDIDRLLWSARILNYQLDNRDISDVEAFIHRKCKNPKTDCNLLVNILLSLWMLERKSEFLIEECFRRGLFDSVVEDTWKPVARLQLLLTCIKIEAPHIEIPEKFTQLNSVGLKISRNVKSLSDKLNNVKNDLEIRDIEINCPIKGINIPGISFRNRDQKVFHIDLLDENSCLKGSREVHGLMKLKLRLLKQVEIHSIQINEDNFLQEEFLNNFLKCF